MLASHALSLIFFFYINLIFFSFEEFSILQGGEHVYASLPLSELGEFYVDTRYYKICYKEKTCKLLHN